MGVLRELFITIKTRNEASKGLLDASRDAEATAQQIQEAMSHCSTSTESAFRKMADKAQSSYNNVKDIARRSSNALKDVDKNAKPGILDNTMKKLSSRFGASNLLAGAIGGAVGALAIGPIIGLINGVVDVLGQAAGKNEAFKASVEGIGKTVERLITALSPLFGLLAPILDFANGVLDVIADKLEQWVPSIIGVAGAFGSLFNGLTGGVNVFEMLGGFIDWIMGLALQLWESLYNVCSSIISIGDSLGIWDAIGQAIDWLAGIVRQAFDTIVGAIRWVSQVIKVFAGMVADQSHSIGEKVTDIIKLLLTALIDFFQKLISLGFDFGKKFLDTAISIGEGFANALIDGVNWGAQQIVNILNAVIDKINSLRFNVPDWVPGIGGSEFSFNLSRINWKGFKHIDTSGIRKEISNAFDQTSRTILDMIDNWQEKYGLNVTVGDLAGKYGVDLSEFDKLMKEYIGSNSKATTAIKDLNTQLGALKDVVKDTQFEKKVEIHLHQSFTNVDQSTAMEAGKSAQDALIAELKRQGFGA